MAKCPKCGAEMNFVKTTVNVKTGKPADLYKCPADELILAIQKVT